MVPTFFPAADGETAFNLLCVAATSTGDATIKRVVGEAFRLCAPLIYTLPCRVARFCKLTQGIYGDEQQVLRRNTLRKYATSSLSPERAARLDDQLIAGTGNISVSRTSGLLESAHRHGLRCPECKKKALASVGREVSHCHECIPYLTYCPMHSVAYALEDPCSTYESLCRTKAQGARRANSIAFSEKSWQVSIAPGDCGTFKRLHELLVERRYINSSSYLAAEQLNDDFAKKFSAGFEDCRLTELVQRPEAARRICYAIRRPDQPGVHPALAILMLWFLEESDGCTAPVPTSARKKPCSQPVQVARCLRAAKRNEWLKARAEHPGATRTVLRRRKCCLYMWLRTNDRRWFDAHLPTRVVRHGNRSQEGYSESMLSVLAASAPKVFCTRAGLPASRSDYHVRLSLGLKQAIFANVKKSPSGASWMGKCTGSRQAFIKERVEWGIALLRERNALISAASIAAAAKLSRRTVDDFLKAKERK